MFPLRYGAVYKTPVEHQPPDENTLAGNTEYPNLNSRDYAKRPLNRNLRMHTAWECIALNGEGEAAIATNKLSGREWAGSLWGFINLDGPQLEASNACFKLQCNALISNLQFVSKNILILALRSGRVQVWSTRSEVRNPKNPYCMFLIGDRCEHLKPIVIMDVIKADNNKAATGSKDGTLKIWDMGGADLFSRYTVRWAHTDVITGIASSYRDAAIIATCSLDSSALLWDDRLTRPAIAICENYTARFKHIAWATPTQSPDEQLLYVGDESGFVHCMDIRSPNKFMKSKQYFDRPIRKIVPMDDKLAVIGDTNRVKVSNAVDHSVCYENAEALNFVRDAVWRSPTELLTVGYEGKMRVHKIQ